MEISIMKDSKKYRRYGRHCSRGFQSTEISIMKDSKKYRRYGRHCSRGFQSTEISIMRGSKNAVGMADMVAIDFNNGNFNQTKPISIQAVHKPVPRQIALLFSW